MDRIGSVFIVRIGDRALPLMCVKKTDEGYLGLQVRPRRIHEYEYRHSDSVVLIDADGLKSESVAMATHVFPFRPSDIIRKVARVSPNKIAEAIRVMAHVAARPALIAKRKKLLQKKHQLRTPGRTRGMNKAIRKLTKSIGDEPRGRAGGKGAPYTGVNPMPMRGGLTSPK